MRGWLRSHDRSGFLSAQGRVPGFHTLIEVRGLCPVTAALAHRGHLRHDDESLPPSDPEPRTACEKCRRRLRTRQFPPGPACLCPRRSKYSIVKQALIGVCSELRVTCDRRITAS